MPHSNELGPGEGRVKEHGYSCLPAGCLPDPCELAPKSIACRLIKFCRPVGMSICVGWVVLVVVQ